MDLEDRARELEAEPETAVTARALGALERVEDLLALADGQPLAARLDLDAKTLAGVGQRGSHRDDALVGEARGGHHDRGERLHDARAVDEQRRHSGLDLALDLHVGADREIARLEHRRHDDVADVGWLGRHLELAGLDARAVEDRVDEHEQLAAALLDDREALLLRLGQRIAADQLGEAEDGVERSLEVVAHRGEEQAAHALGRLARVDRALLRAGELAEDAAERVDGVEERADVREPRLVQDDRAAHDLRDAGASHLAGRERDVGFERHADARTEQARERDGDEREQHVDARHRREARRAEAHERCARDTSERSPASRLRRRDERCARRRTSGSMWTRKPSAAAASIASARPRTSPSGAGAPGARPSIGSKTARATSVASATRASRSYVRE